MQHLRYRYPTQQQNMMISPDILTPLPIVTSKVVFWNLIPKGRTPECALRVPNVFAEFVSILDKYKDFLYYTNVNFSGSFWYLIFHKISFAISVDPCADTVCPETETCSGGVCSCGTAATCQGNSLADVCDGTNSVCKCGQLDACDPSKVCRAGTCKGN